MNLYYKFENSNAEIKATSTVEVFKEPQLKVLFLNNSSCIWF